MKKFLFVSLIVGLKRCVYGSFFCLWWVVVSMVMMFGIVVERLLGIVLCMVIGVLLVLRNMFGVVLVGVFLWLF